jgi:hypothetical protein
MRFALLTTQASTDQKINVTEELVAVSPIKCARKGYDIANAVLSTLERYNLKLEEHCGFVTDAAAAIVAENEGVAAQIRKEASLFGNKEFLQCHCIYSAPKILCEESISLKKM